MKADENKGARQEGKLSPNDQFPPRHPIGERATPRAEQKRRPDLYRGQKGGPLRLPGLLVGQPDERGDLCPRADERDELPYEVERIVGMSQ